MSESSSLETVKPELNLLTEVNNSREAAIKQLEKFTYEAAVAATSSADFLVNAKNTFGLVGDQTYRLVNDGRLIVDVQGVGDAVLTSGSLYLTPEEYPVSLSNILNDLKENGTTITVVEPKPGKTKQTYQLSNQTGEMITLTVSPPPEGGRGSISFGVFDESTNLSEFSINIISSLGGFGSDYAHSMLSTKLQEKTLADPRPAVAPLLAEFLRDPDIVLAMENETKHALAVIQDLSTIDHRLSFGDGTEAHADPRSEQERATDILLKSSPALVKELFAYMQAKYLSVDRNQDVLLASLQEIKTNYLNSHARLIVSRAADQPSFSGSMGELSHISSTGESHIFAVVIDPNAGEKYSGEVYYHYNDSVAYRLEYYVEDVDHPDSKYKNIGGREGFMSFSDAKLYWCFREADRSGYFMEVRSNGEIPVDLSEITEIAVTNETAHNEVVKLFPATQIVQATMQNSKQL